MDNLYLSMLHDDQYLRYPEKNYHGSQVYI